MDVSFSQFCRNPQAVKSKIKEPADLVLGKGCFLSLQMAAFSDKEREL